MKIPVCYFYDGDGRDCTVEFSLFIGLLGVCAFAVLFVIPTTFLVLQICVFLGVFVNTGVEEVKKNVKKKFFQRSRRDSIEGENTSINEDSDEKTSVSPLTNVKRISVLCCFFELRSLQFVLNTSFSIAFLLGSLFAFAGDSIGLELTLLIIGTLYVISPILSLFEEFLFVDEPFPCYRLVFSGHSVTLGFGYLIFITCCYFNLYFFYDDRTTSWAKAIRFITVLIVFCTSPCKVFANTAVYSCFFRFYSPSRSKFEVDEYFRDVFSIASISYLLPFQLIAVSIFFPSDLDEKHSLFVMTGLYIVLSLFALASFTVGTGAIMKSLSLFFNFFSCKHGMMRFVWSRLVCDTVILVGEIFSLFALGFIVIVVSVVRGHDPDNEGVVMLNVYAGAFLILGISIAFLFISVLLISIAYSVSFYSCIGTCFMKDEKDESATSSKEGDDEKKPFLEVSGIDPPPQESSDESEEEESIDNSFFGTFFLFPKYIQKGHQLFSYVWVACIFLLGEKAGGIIASVFIMSFTVVVLEIFLPVVILSTIIHIHVLIPTLIVCFFVCFIPCLLLNIQDLSFDRLKKFLRHLSFSCVIQSFVIWVVMFVVGNVGLVCLALVSIFLAFNPLIMVLGGCVALTLGLSSYFLLDREGRIADSFLEKD